MIVDYRGIDWLAFFSARGLVEREKRQRRNKGSEVFNCVAAFDIETSTVWNSKESTDAHSFLYVWQMQIEDYTIIGRTWEEWFLFLDVLRDVFKQYATEHKLGKPPVLVSWIHNAAYEFSFISGLYPFTDEECFFRDVRKPIYFRMFDCFEFRCSYIQTNLSLAKLTEQTGVEHKKSGQKYDYNKIRYPWTELSEYELSYIVTDVASLVAAMRIRMERAGDTLLTIPLTSTGYVRRECKEALKDRYLQIADIKPWRGLNGQRIYKLLRAAFRGGNTHGNRYYVGRIINDVYSYDISSSYPTQQLTQKFPMRGFKWLDGDLSIDRICMFIGLGYAVVGMYRFTGLRLRRPREPIPYISLSRTESYGYKLDNGRILTADYVEIALTEIDLEIVLDQYAFDRMEVVECMVAMKDYLPEEYRNVIQSYYRKKTALKGDDSEDGKYMYMKSKNLLNSVYGMSATDPIHQEIKYAEGEYRRSGYETMTDKEIEKALHSAAFPYQWGVYTTAYARAQLQKAIKLCGDKIIYCDTDSVKTAGPVPIERLNDKLRIAAEKHLAYADDMNGCRHYIGLFESDGHYKQFITQGAKRYAYISDSGKLGVTVAGVSTAINEETGKSFAAEELKTLKRFKPGMIWTKAGGTMAVYNDEDNFVYTDPETGKTVTVRKNVAIVPTTYEMTYSRDYRLLLKEISLYSEFKREIE